MRVTIEVESLTRTVEITRDTVDRVSFAGTEVEACWLGDLLDAAVADVRRACGLEVTS